MNEIKILIFIFQNFVLGTEGVKKKLSALINVIQTLMKTRKGEIIQCLSSDLFPLNWSDLRPCQLMRCD